MTWVHYVLTPMQRFTMMYCIYIYIINFVYIKYSHDSEFHAQCDPQATMFKSRSKIPVRLHASLLGNLRDDIACAHSNFSAICMSEPRL
jgi:hypothetical protein